MQAFRVKRSEASLTWLRAVIDRPFAAAVLGVRPNFVQIDAAAVCMWKSLSSPSFVGPSPSTDTAWYSRSTFSSDLLDWRPGHLMLHIQGSASVTNKYERLSNISAECGLSTRPLKSRRGDTGQARLDDRCLAIVEEHAHWYFGNIVEKISPKGCDVSHLLTSLRAHDLGEAEARKLQ